MNKLKIIAVSVGVLLIGAVGVFVVQPANAMTRDELRTKNALMCEQIFLDLLNIGRSLNDAGLIGYAYDVYAACSGANTNRVRGGALGFLTTEEMKALYDRLIAAKTDAAK